MTNLNFNHKIIIVLIFLLLVFGISFTIFRTNSNVLSDNVSLTDIWLNLSTNELVWKYSNGASYTSINPLNIFANIFPSQNFIVNENHVYKISNDNQLVLEKTFSNQVFVYENEQNYKVMNKDDSLLSIKNSFSQNYSLLTKDNYQIYCWKIVDIISGKLCLSKNNGEVFKIGINTPAVETYSYTMKNYLLNDLFIEPGSTLMIYNAIQTITDNSLFDEEHPDKENPQTNDNEYVLIKINDKEVILKETFIYSIIKKNDIYILNTMTKSDWSNRINNYSIYSLNKNGNLTLLHKNTSGIIIW